MSNESPAAVLYSSDGYELDVVPGALVPTSPRAILVNGSDGTNVHTFLMDTSGRQIVVGAAAVGAAPAGSPLYLGGVSTTGNMINWIGNSVGGQIVGIGGNCNFVQSNATITTSGSAIVATNYYGVQQINLIVNVTASPTGTTPVITYTIQEVDPGNATTTFGSSASTSAINATGVFTAVLTSTHSSAVKVSWTVTGTTPSFTGVYTTVVSKSTPDTQTISGTITADNSSVSATGSAAPANATFSAGNVTTAAPSYSNNTLGGLSITTVGGLRIDGVYPVTTATASAPDAMVSGGYVTTAAPTYTTGQLNALSLTTVGALRVDGYAGTFPVIANVSSTSPTYISGQENSLSLTTAGALRVDGSAVTQPITGTGTAGTPAAGVVTIQGATGMTPISISGSVNVDKSSTGTITSVGASVTSVTLLASNANRISATFVNDTSNGNFLYLALASSASTSAYTIKIWPGNYWELPINYTGIVTGIWLAASGACRITELT